MQLKRRKMTVEIQPAARPSRIRRDPPVREIEKPIRAYPAEHEVWVVVVGVILFALAITILTFGVSQITSH